MKRSFRTPITEHAIQKAIIEWRELMAPMNPYLELLHAIPNGARLPGRTITTASGQTRRLSKEGVRLKREGLTSGIPDLCWPVPRGPYHGLYIEMKKPKGSTERKQRDTMRTLESLGYHVAVFRDAELAIDRIKAYWALGPYDYACIHYLPALKLRAERA